MIIGGSSYYTQHKDIVRFDELYQLLSNVLMFDLNLILLTT